MKESNRVLKWIDDYSKNKRKNIEDKVKTLENEIQQMRSLCDVELPGGFFHQKLEFLYWLRKDSSTVETCSTYLILSVDEVSQLLPIWIFAYNR